MEPTIEGEPLLTRPTAPLSKITPTSAVNLPSMEREPLNLLREGAGSLASVATETPPAEPQESVRQPRGIEFPDPVDLGDPDAISNDDRTWYSMFTPSGGTDSELATDPFSPEPTFAQPPPEEESGDQASGKHSRDEFWRAVQSLMVNPRTAAGAAGVLTVIVVITSIGSFRRPDAGRAAAQSAAAASLPGSAGAAGASSEAPGGLESRAALFIVDEFTEGVSDWTHPEAFELTEGGPVRIKSGVALRRSTLGLRDARFEFEAHIEHGGLGWRVRASETGGYYEFKLDRDQGTLTRFAMVLGEADEASVIELPDGVLQPEGFNRIAIQVEGDRISTLINGRGVDFWTDPRLTAGGIGLVAGTGDSALIRKMKVVANDDFWGMVLRGAFDTFGSG